MPKSLSLKRKKDFDLLFKKGRRLYSKNFTLTYIPSEKLKIAFITPKKILKRANKRNYNKRLVRELIRIHIYRNLKKPLHIAIMCKSDLSLIKNQTSTDEIANELKTTFQNLY